MATTAHTSVGVYDLDPVHSTVQFAIRHALVSTFRGSFSGIEARLTVGEQAVELAGRVPVESISIVEPGSVPGALKNALDWVSRPYPDNALRGKPVGVVGASQGTFGALWAQADLRRILKTIGANVADREVAVARAHEAFTAAGRVREPEVECALCATIHDLVSQAARRAA